MSMDPNIHLNCSLQKDELNPEIPLNQQNYPTLKVEREDPLPPEKRDSRTGKRNCKM